jgi:hypothetical protein
VQLSLMNNPLPPPVFLTSPPSSPTSSSTPNLPKVNASERKKIQYKVDLQNTELIGNKSDAEKLKEIIMDYNTSSPNLSTISREDFANKRNTLQSSDLDALRKLKFPPVPERDLKKAHKTQSYTTEICKKSPKKKKKEKGNTGSGESGGGTSFKQKKSKISSIENIEGLNFNHFKLV